MIRLVALLCLWEHGFELDYDSTEVWTAGFLVPNSNDRAIELWDDVLLGGRRMTARGGSDSHHQHDAESARGLPTGRELRAATRPRHRRSAPSASVASWRSQPIYVGFE